MDLFIFENVILTLNEEDFRSLFKVVFIPSDNKIDYFREILQTVKMPIMMTNPQVDKLLDTRSAQSFCFWLVCKQEFSDVKNIICYNATSAPSTNEVIHRLQLLHSSTAFLKFSGRTSSDLTLDIDPFNKMSQSFKNNVKIITDF